MKSITILGAGESGFGAAMLAHLKGFNVFVSDSNKINEERKSEMTKKSIMFEEENHSFDKIKLSDFVIKSPGISNSSEIILKIKSSGIPIISEIEFASNYSNSFKICITGTNGKTTTTKLIYKILKRAGLDVGLAGNIGDSFSKMLLSGDRDIYVLEISSFQLDDIKKFRPNISVITNIIEDHLDRYENDFRKYIDAKMKIAKNQKSSDYLIYNSDLVIAHCSTAISYAVMMNKKILLLTSNQITPLLEKMINNFSFALNIPILNVSNKYKSFISQN